MNFRLPHKHNFTLRLPTVTEWGAEFVCTKCLKTDYYSWRTNMEITRAKIYLTIKESKRIIKEL